MLLSPTGSNASLTSPSFWNKFKSKNKEPDLREKQAHMALTRSRLLTLAFGEMETIRTLPNSFAELEQAARDWARPPPDAVFSLRVPVEYASIHAARLVAGPYIYLTSEDSFQIAAMGAQGLRVEIVSDAPPPPDEPPPPPPPPVLEMPATFNLELVPGQHVALDTTVTSDELDMARMEDGTTVDGMFWGKLDIVHNGDDHRMEFSGTRLTNQQDYSPDFMFDSRVMTKLAVAAKPTAARCNLSILAPEMTYCDVTLMFSPLWKLGTTWPPASLADNKVRYFLRVHPGGALEHFESEVVSNALYYEAIPDAGMLEPEDVIGPRNGYAMSFRDFIPHLINVLDQLGLSLYARTNFINNNIASFAAHKNIAYRFMSPSKIAAAVDITITSEPCIFTRLFLIFRGLNDDEVGIFAGAGEKEANTVNWREVVAWSEESKDPTMFRVLETSVLEVS
ncbi:hypothetical protein DFJ43DRAFT_1074272 [Lentinula guzmanii]|uniref:Uncharacterized protein n=1 Tax=Lentinula guzmanii TaxID=2804957 RepID=A0AA38MZW5_9AGAR|nr:hypothetical protein DFJ43DRAFT_1074272 [Lentinula guzmanii]